MKKKIFICIALTCFISTTSSPEPTFSKCVPPPGSTKCLSTPTPMPAGTTCLCTCVKYDPNSGNNISTDVRGKACTLDSDCLELLPPPDYFRGSCRKTCLENDYGDLNEPSDCK